MLAKAGWNVHAFLAWDLGGVSDLRQAGVATVQIVPSIATNPTSVLANCNLDLLTVVDMPEVIGPLRDHFSGPLVFGVHTPIEKVLQKVVAADLDNVDRLLVPSLWSPVLDWADPRNLGSRKSRRSAQHY